MLSIFIFILNIWQKLTKIYNLFYKFSFVVAIVLDGKREEQPDETDTLSKLLKDLQLDDKNEFNILAICVKGDLQNEEGEHSYNYRK